MGQDSMRATIIGGIIAGLFSTAAAVLPFVLDQSPDKPTEAKATSSAPSWRRNGPNGPGGSRSSSGGGNWNRGNSSYGNDDRDGRTRSPRNDDDEPVAGGYGRTPQRGPTGSRPAGILEEDADDIGVSRVKPASSERMADERGRYDGGRSGTSPSRGGGSRPVPKTGSAPVTNPGLDDDSSPFPRIPTTSPVENPAAGSLDAPAAAIFPATEPIPADFPAAAADSSRPFKPAPGGASSANRKPVRSSGRSFGSRPSPRTQEPEIVPASGTVPVASEPVEGQP